MGHLHSCAPLLCGRVWLACIYTQLRSNCSTRPYHRTNTDTHPNVEVKTYRAWLVRWWGTPSEAHVLSFFSFFCERPVVIREARSVVHSRGRWHSANTFFLWRVCLCIYCLLLVFFLLVYFIICIRTKPGPGPTGSSPKKGKLPLNLEHGKPISNGWTLFMPTG